MSTAMGQNGQQKSNAEVGVHTAPCPPSLSVFDPQVRHPAVKF